jgi:hypothetical protein
MAVCRFAEILVLQRDDLKIKYSSFVNYAALAGNPNPIRVRGQKKQGFVCKY